MTRGPSMFTWTRDRRVSDEAEWGARHPDWYHQAHVRHMRRLRQRACVVAVRRHRLGGLP